MQAVQATHLTAYAVVVLSVRLRRHLHVTPESLFYFKVIKEIVLTNIQLSPLKAGNSSGVISCTGCEEFFRLAVLWNRYLLFGLRA